MDDTRNNFPDKISLSYLKFWKCENMAWSTGASPEEKLKGNIRNDFFKEPKASKN